MDATTDLEQDLYEYDPDGRPPDEEAPPRPTDDREAAGMMRQLRWLRREKHRIAAVARAEVERINGWAYDRTAGLDRRTAQLETALEGFTRAALANQKRRSIPLPYGALKLTAPRASVDFADEAAFVTWAEANDRRDLLKTSGSRSAVRDALDAGTLAASTSTEKTPDATLTTIVADETGEAVPGVRLVTPLRDSFTVSITGPEEETE